MSGPTRREAWRFNLRSLFCAASRCLGLGMTCPVDSTANDFSPRSTPTTESGCEGSRSVRVISTENEQNQRPDLQEMVADRMRAVPRST